MSRDGFAPSSLAPPHISQPTKTNKMARFTDNEIKLLHHGIRWIGFRRPDRVRVKTLVRRFKCIFGKGPVAINALSNYCKNAMDGFDEKYAFATLNWLKTYAFETDLAGRYGCCERTVEDKTKVYTKLFASFKSSKICFDGFKQGYVYQLVVDDSDSPCEEFRCDPSAR